MKNLFAFCIVILMAHMSFGQTKIQPGIRLGLNSSSISNSDFDSRNGINAAAFVEIRFNERYGLQPEIAFSRQGGNSNDSAINDLPIDYLSIALANKLYLIPGAGLHLIAGPSFDFNFENNPINIINDDTDSEVGPFDFSVFGGIGYEFDFGLALEVRYKQGLLELDAFDFFDVNEDFDNDNTLNVVYQFGIAYKF